MPRKVWVPSRGCFRNPPFCATERPPEGRRFATRGRGTLSQRTTPPRHPAGTLTFAEARAPKVGHEAILQVAVVRRYQDKAGRRHDCATQIALAERHGQRVRTRQTLQVGVRRDDPTCKMEAGARSRAVRSTYSRRRRREGTTSQRPSRLATKRTSRRGVLSGLRE